MDELKKEIEKLKYQMQLVGNMIDSDIYPIESLILSFDWDNDDLNKAHDIFEKYDKKIEVKEEDINWVKFEKELEEQFSISYQEVKLIILAFYKNRQWSEVSYQYAKQNSCIELNGIVLEYERNFK